MPSLKSNFEELCERIQRGRDKFGSASFEPIYYLIFDPAQILEVKKQIPAWISKLKNDFGWSVETFSISEEIEYLIQRDPRWTAWVSIDKNNPQKWKATNESIANALTVNDSFQKRLDEFLTLLEEKKNSLALITDLEALHPYLRIGSIEAQLQGRFKIPTIFLYPGTRVGKTNLRFLGFYPDDGNYRSEHIGG
ncbi:MAG: BREX protein BrxB domain-containing protein [Aridibacter sp.]